MSASSPATMPESVFFDADGSLEQARRVIDLEIQGLQALSENLGEPFLKALDILHAVEGRVIVSGMGKSGHVARKISATLASTGTPAHYVHPGEASHGDLGMITGRDAVMALSNSGETSELADLVAYCNRFEIPLIGITGREKSTLAKSADVALVLADTPEACPLGLAPTTSTTVMLALGDALAVTLLERRGFSADDFHVFHPGGKLGRRLLKVQDIMHSGEEMPLTGPETPMSETLILMTAKKFGCAGILDGEGNLAGIVTDGDLRRHMSADLIAMTTGAVMTAGPKTIRPGALASEAVRVMNALSITNLFVVEDGKPVGILHIHDCLLAGVA